MKRCPRFIPRSTRQKKEEKSLPGPTTPPPHSPPKPCNRNSPPGCNSSTAFSGARALLYSRNALFTFTGPLKQHLDQPRTPPLNRAVWVQLLFSTQCRRCVFSFLSFFSSLLGMRPERKVANTRLREGQGV